MGGSSTHGPDRARAVRRTKEPWSLAASGPLYNLVYRRRGRGEARRQWRALRALLEPLGLGPRTLVLDVGCGSGRHLAHAAADGHRALGVDRSPAALARARTAVPGRLLRADGGRLPLGSARVGLALSLFSSFAHDGRAAGRAELCELARVLRPGGLLVLDLPEPSRVRLGLRRASSTRIGGLEIRERRRLGPGGRAVHKRVELRRGRFPVARWFEHLPLIEAAELGPWLLEAGFEPLRLAPAEGLDGFGPERLLVVARRAQGPETRDGRGYTGRSPRGRSSLP